jgi:hypothetical protein
MRQEENPNAKYVVFCIPTIKKPYQCTLDALEASVPLFDQRGWKHSLVSNVGSPYISCARSIMLRKALDAKAEVIVFIDHDLSWRPQDLLKLVETEGDVVSGNYRFKYEPEEYMGIPLPDLDGNVQVRPDGAIKGYYVPAGFLKITRKAVNKFIDSYPELCYGDRCNPHIDIFNHGAHQNVWFGEDYAFSRRWRDCGGELIIIPDLQINHHTPDEVFEGNYHEYLMKQPGGVNDPAR